MVIYNSKVVNSQQKKVGGVFHKYYGLIQIYYVSNVIVYSGNTTVIKMIDSH